MILDRAVLIRSAVQSAMETDTVSSEEYLDGSPGNADIHLLLNVLIRNRVVLLVHRNMVVGCGGRDLPYCKFEGPGRKRQEKGFLIRIIRPRLFNGLFFLNRLSAIDELYLSVHCIGQT